MPKIILILQQNTALGFEPRKYAYKTPSPFIFLLMLHCFPACTCHQWSITQKELKCGILLLFLLKWIHDVLGQIKEETASRTHNQCMLPGESFWKINCYIVQEHESSCLWP